MSPPESDNTTEEVVAGGEALVAAATNNNLQSDPLPLNNTHLGVANNNNNHSEVVANGGTKDEGSLREAMEIDKSINNAAESQVNDETTAQPPPAAVATAPADVEPTTTEKDMDDNGNDNDISKKSPQHESTTTTDIANNLTLMPAEMNISESTITTTATAPDSPRRGERVIKKRRNDDFVYTKKDEVEEKKQQKVASSTTTTTTPSSPSKKKKTPKKQSSSTPPQQQRKRPNHCPSTDSILIDVPLGVTADLGIALKRTRKKRIKRVQNWITSAPYNTKVSSSKPSSSSANAAVNSATTVGKKKKKSESLNKIKKKGANGNDTDDDDDSFINDDDDIDDDNNEHDITQDITLDDETDLGRTPTRNQFGTVLDYLEAKYVRGVMIADYDDRELAREQEQQKQEQEQEHARAKQKGEEDEDSEGDNSCYDDEDGFIDDSLILEDVAGQVMASSTYGLTQIEEEARRRKEERSKKESGGGGGVDTSIDQSTLEKLGITDDKMMDDNNLAEDGGGGGMDADFDDGFFVNLGDLEMAEGWNGDNVVISPSKKKKRVKKRASKGAASKDDKPMKKKKKLSLSSTSSSPTKKKKKAADDTKKKKTDKTKQKSDSSSKSTPSPVKNGKKKTAPSSGKSEDKQPKKKDQTVKHPPKKMTPEKERSTQLRKVMKRKYNACVKMIKELTTDHLPRKQRNKKTVKLSVNIPEGKTIGDEITFANPNVPGQKLKVAIPSKADMEKRTFVASVPGPKVPFTKKENSLPKVFRDALTDYSNAYDDWVAAEAIHNESLPEKKRKDYKINDERMKKFDEMIPEFPTKLATPIDASYLRLAVRQVKSNRARQEKRKSGAESPKKRQVVTEKVEINMNVPQKGSEFASISFNKQDFQE